MTLDKTIELSKEAIIYARKKINASSTDLFLQLTTDPSKENEYYMAENNIERLRNKSSFNLTASLRDLFRVPDIGRDETVREIKKNAVLIKENPVGNCNEYSFLALNYLRKKAIHRAELCGVVENGGHAFVVINRAETSNSLDITTWGACAVICDPWANRTYPASKLLTELQLDDPNDKSLQPSHPKRHQFLWGCSIGGNSTKNNQLAIKEAEKKLNVLKRLLITDTALTCNIDRDIATLPQRARETNATMTLERELTKIIRKYLKAYLDLTPKAWDLEFTLNYWEKITNLFNGWRASTPNLDHAFTHIIEYHDQTIALLLINLLEKDHIKNILSPWTLHSLILRNRSHVFLKLLSQLDSEQINRRLIMPNGVYINREANINLFYLIYTEGLLDCFNALLKRTNASDFNKYCQNKTFPIWVLIRFGVEAFFSVMNKTQTNGPLQTKVSPISIFIPSKTKEHATPLVPSSYMPAK